MLKPFIFDDDINHATWVCLNLNDHARDRFKHLVENPMLDADVCNTHVQQWTQEAGGRYSWTPYGELRSDLWRDHYHDPDTMRHPAIDLNVPAGTVVYAPRDCEVIRVLRDDSWGGWGGCVFFEMAQAHLGCRYFIFAHLKHQHLPRVGWRFKAGEIVGTVADKRENGQWYPHLHVQMFDQRTFDQFTPELENMDGYCPNDMVYNHGMSDPQRLIMR